ncbi:MAG: acyl carrier protein [Desulfobacterales bacterium]|jgi:acyl carrier protein|nr:acyl carrier protein [Desulfobacterales bacterium]MDD3080972.1 acyl carrier protein [Desulfobacterales bacterium]MDD3951516.1 acyl carrier protein [Desulfobacterales bacterium]MDY0378628.1 acyl carrier protein [Desulfobacterales bacterium]
MSIAEQMKEIIAEKLSVDIEDVTPQASFVEDLGADSLDLVELIMSMEEEFNIDISDEDAGKLVTVQDAIQYVGTH